MIIKVIDKLQRELYRLFHPKLWGKNLQINGLPKIYDIKHLRLGRNVSINTGCVLQCYGGLEIGNNVTISDGAKILTRSLDTKNYIDNAIKDERDHVDRKVVIGSGTWIAANALILPGVSIAPNCIIAAGGVVSRSIAEDNSLYAGVPAKRLKGLNE